MSGRPAPVRFQVTKAAFLLLLSGVVAGLHVQAAAGAPSLSIAITATGDGLSYSAAMDGEHWLSAPPVSATGSSLSVCTGGKVLRSFRASAAPTHSNGTDGFGAFTAEVHELQAAGLSVRLTKRSYPGRPGMLVLGLSFPERTSLCPDAKLSTSFPSWSATAGRAPNLTALTWTSEHAVSRASWGRGLSTVLDSGVGGGPVVLYDEATKRVLMFASLDHHKVIGQTSSRTRHAQGLSAGIAGVPAGFEYSTVFFAGTGVTSTVYAWGRAMQQYHGHDVSWGTSWRDDTVTLTHLGYFTDNGAYYGDWPPTQTSNRPWSAEEGLLIAKQALDAAGVPIAYMQLDDWWYYGRFQLGSVRCVQRWEGDRDTINAATRKPALFPGGLPAFQRSLGADFGLMLYTPFWCGNYENPGHFNMTVAPRHAPLAGTKIVTPEDSRGFFDAIMEQGMKLTNGHMAAYEIDFLAWNFQSMLGVSITEPQQAQLWYQGMADAAAARNVTIQYCLGDPSDILASLAFPAVSNARASFDYCDTARNTREMAGSSLLMGALNMAPSKDVFWTTSPQPGPNRCDQVSPPGSYTKQPHVKLDALLAVLSLGPVAIGDAVGHTDAALLMRCCSAGGLLLRPDRPLSMVDQSLHMAAPPGLGGNPRPNPPHVDVRSTHAAVPLRLPGTGSAAEESVLAHYVVAVGLSKETPLGPTDLYPTPAGDEEFGFLRFNQSSWGQNATRGPRNCADGASAAECITILPKGALPIVTATTAQEQDFSFGMLVPRLANGWYLLGETDKFVPISRNRIVSLAMGAGQPVVGAARSATVAAAALNVTVQGEAHEHVQMVAVDANSNTVRVAETLLSAAGTGSLVFPAVATRLRS